MTDRELIEALELLAAGTSNNCAAVVLYALLGALHEGTERQLANFCIVFAEAMRDRLVTAKQARDN